MTYPLIVKERNPNNKGETMALLGYYPEMDQARPAAPIEAQNCYFGGKLQLRTNLELKGRGVKFTGKIAEGQVCGPRAAQLVGMNEYMVTSKAFDKIKAEHDVAMEFLLS